MDFATPLNEAVRLAIMGFVTAVVLIENVPWDVPEGTKADFGTVANVLSLANETEIPPVGAGPERMIVPVADVPPNTAVGATLIPARAGGVIVNWDDTEAPFIVAVIVANVLDATVVVLIKTGAPIAPTGTVTDAGTFAALLLLFRVTERPPAGASPDKMTFA